jgi:hypothetical protein
VRYTVGIPIRRCEVKAYSKIMVNYIWNPSPTGSKKRIGEKSKYDDGYDASKFKHAQSGESVMFTTHLLYGNEYCVFGLKKMRISESNCLHFTGIGIVININIC